MAGNAVNGPADGPKVIFGKENKNWSGAKKAQEGSNTPADVNSARGDFGSTGNDVDHELQAVADSLARQESEMMDYVIEMDNLVREEAVKVEEVKRQYMSQIKNVSKAADIARYQTHYNIADAIKDNPDWTQNAQLFGTVSRALEAEKDALVEDRSGNQVNPVIDAMKNHFGEDNFYGTYSVIIIDYLNGTDVDLEVAAFKVDKKATMTEQQHAAENLDDYLQGLTKYVKSQGAESFEYYLWSNGGNDDYVKIQGDVDTVQKSGEYTVAGVGIYDYTDHNKTMHEIFDDFYDHFNK